MMTVVPIAKAAPGWSPSPFQAPAIRPRLAQPVVTTPTTPPGATVPGMNPPRPPFIDSALVSFVFDALGATAYGILSYGSASVKAHTWSKIFGIVSGLLALKGIYDLSNARYR